MIHALRSVWACLAAALLGTAAGSLQAQPAPAAVFFQQPEILQAALSPSGKRLAVTSAKGLDRDGLVVFDLQNGNKPTRVAQSGEGDVVHAHWVNDDWLVFSVIDLNEGEGSPQGQRRAPGLYAARADGTHVRQLVAGYNFGDIEARITQRGPLRYNHSLLHVPAMKPGAANDEVVVGEWVLVDNQLDALKPLWLNVRTGLARAMDLQAPEHTTNWLFDGTGAARIAMTSFAGRRAVHWREPGQEGWRLLAEADALRMPFTPRFVDDAGGLLVTQARGTGGHSVLTRYDFALGAPATTPWVQVPGFDFDGSVVSENAGTAVLGVRVRADAESTVWTHPALKRMQQLADERFPG